MTQNATDPLGVGAENSSGTLRAPIAPQMVGHAVLTPSDPVEAGSWQSLALTYTAGPYGIDDSGSLRVCFRFASDQSPPQFNDPAGANYTEITASNGAVLDYRFDPKGNVRPWDNTIYIKVVKGYLLPGDTITLRFGVRDHGGPGMRMQTFCEDSFEFRVLADPLATFNYQPVPDQPQLRLVPGPAARFVATLPTQRRPGQPFSLHLKAEDRWGNPTDRAAGTYRLTADAPVDGLPGTVTFPEGARHVRLDGLTANETVTITLSDDTGAQLARSNPMEIDADATLLPYWADLHGQSEETIGTNSARAYFAFARDLAPVDAIGHQGNDFQITAEFWAHLDSLTEAFEVPGEFLAIPGYEWSGNTGLGGDRNVFFPETGRTIRRSSHALIPDDSDIDTDALTAGDLFEAFAGNGEWDVVCYAHCGGRYADLRVAHDGRFETSVEVHSSWGTFEWLVHDAFDLGFRMGIVGNSDGHKGRPGASYPGAGKFGAIGGLTCLLMEELTRPALFDCLRKRRHYATTGGPTGRPLIDLHVAFDETAQVHDDDPALGPAKGTPGDRALMGQIVHLPKGGATLHARIRAAAPIERVDIFNGRDLVDSIAAHSVPPDSHRIRIEWEGAEYRGRFRQVLWDGTARFSHARIRNLSPVNFFNPDKRLEQVNPHTARWQSLTTGNTAAADIWLDDATTGTLTIDTPLVQKTIELASITEAGTTFDRSATLPRWLRVARLPERMHTATLTLTRAIPLRDSGDNPVYIRLVQEDGTRAWTSPVYIFRDGG
ncbi:MAG: hypothetical protein ACE368_19905 [Paracoccaceae bacterium]